VERATYVDMIGVNGAYRLSGQRGLWTERHLDACGRGPVILLKRDLHEIFKTEISPHHFKIQRKRKRHLDMKTSHLLTKKLILQMAPKRSDALKGWARKSKQ